MTSHSFLNNCLPIIIDFITVTFSKQQLQPFKNTAPNNNFMFMFLNDTETMDLFSYLFVLGYKV